jgi:hypothetical protein
MQKFYFLAALVIISVSGSAQIKKGSILLGGQLSYYTDKIEIGNDEQQYSAGTFGISLGKAIKENRVLGFNFGFSPGKQENIRRGSDTFNLSINRFDVGVFYREYKRLAKDFYFFGQVDGAFITSNQKEKYRRSSDIKVTQRGAFLTLTPGFSYQLFKKMQLEVTIPGIVGIQYSVNKVDSQNPLTQSSKRKQLSVYSNLNNGTNLSWLGVGFRFVL